MACARIVRSLSTYERCGCTQRISADIVCCKPPRTCHRRIIDRWGASDVAPHDYLVGWTKKLRKFREIWSRILVPLVSDSGSYCPLILVPGDTKNQSVLGLRFCAQNWNRKLGTVLGPESDPNSELRFCSTSSPYILFCINNGTACLISGTIFGRRICAQGLDQNPLRCMSSDFGPRNGVIFGDRRTRTAGYLGSSDEASCWRHRLNFCAGLAHLRVRFYGCVMHLLTTVCLRGTTDRALELRRSMPNCICFVVPSMLRATARVVGV